MVWQGGHAPEPGDYCVAEVPVEGGPARLVEILGSEDRPQWDTAAVASQFRLRSHFPRRALDEAAHFSLPDIRALPARDDLRGVLSFTIDPEDARDHDDALSCQALPQRRFLVGIHIADVSHYVSPGSPLDREARARGTSTYLPDGVLPMLPERLSSDLCSLRPEQERLTLSVLAELDARAELLRFRIAESVIRSAHRLSYGEVQEFLESRRPFGADLSEALTWLSALSQSLRARRFAAGALDLDIPEVKAWTDEKGRPLRLERREHLESHEIVEEFMLLANRVIGSEGARRRAGLLYRVHEAPLERKLAELDAMLKALGLPRLSSYREAAPALHALLHIELPEDKRRLVHRLILRSLARARYLERDLGHFGLAAHEYCHFTSPIRRYPDLHNHRRVKHWLRGQRDGVPPPEELAVLAEECTATEVTAERAEREGVRVKALRYLEGRLGEDASGIITGLIPQGFFVELSDAPAEGFVRVEHYVDDRFVLDPSGVRMVGRRTRKRFTLGDSVRVVIARVDVAARECDMALAGRRGRRS